MNQLRPELFLIGAPKCGTSSLASYLATHNDILLGSVKEPNYWSTDLPHFAKREGLTSLERYLDLYQTSQAPRYALDASTHYLMSHTAPENVQQFCPTAKIIVCIRPQWELAHAWHMQMFNAGYETCEDFSVAWKECQNLGIGESRPMGPEPRLANYGWVASIGEQLANWRRYFPTEQLLLIPINMLRDEPQATYQKCLEFVGLPDDNKTNFGVENQAFRSRSRLMSRLFRTRLVRSTLNRLGNTLPAVTRDQAKRLVKSFLYKNRKREPLSPELLGEMKEYFEPDNRLLSMNTDILAGPISWHAKDSV